MKRQVMRSAKVALCRVCHGTGHVQGPDYESTTCPQCEGSGRVTVSAKMEFDIRPYKENPK